MHYFAPTMATDNVFFKHCVLECFVEVLNSYNIIFNVSIGRYITTLSFNN